MARNKHPPRRVISKPPRNGLRISTPTQAHLSASVHPPVEIFTSSAGIRAEILRLGVSRRKPEQESPTHIILLPGNPGVIEYYRPLMRMLYARLPHDVKKKVGMHGVGLPGHDLSELNGEKEYDIAAHVDFVVEYIRQLGDGRVLVAGHSYGSYLATRVVEMLGAERCAIAMLMPALWQMAECAGGMSRFILRDYGGVSNWTLWFLTTMLPPVVRDGAIRWMGHFEGVSDVSRRFVDGRRRGLYRNIGALGRDEMKMIKEPRDCGVGKRSLLVWCEADKWCPTEARRRIVKVFEGVRVEEATGCTHAMVLEGGETEKVARIVASWVCERVREDK